MKPLTLNQKRFIAGAFVVVLLFAAGNEFLEWGLVGNAAKGLRLGVMFVGLVGFSVFGPRMLEEIEAHERATREAEDEAERVRDKSNDAAERERLRRAIGMPSNTSLERTREEETVDFRQRPARCSAESLDSISSVKKPSMTIRRYMAIIVMAYFMALLAMLGVSGEWSVMSTINGVLGLLAIPALVAPVLTLVAIAVFRDAGGSVYAIPTALHVFMIVVLVFAAITSS